MMENQTDMIMENEMEPGVMDLGNVGPGFALRSAMCSGVRLSRIRGNDARSALMCPLIGALTP